MNKKVRKKVIDIIIKNIQESQIQKNEINPESNEDVVIDISQVSDNQDLTELYMDSLTFIRIVVDIENEFNIEIPDESLLITEMNTVSKIIDVVSTALY